MNDVPTIILDRRPDMRFKPKPDITAAELAEVIEHFRISVDESYFRAMPRHLHRHFHKIGDSIMTDTQILDWIQATQPTIQWGAAGVRLTFTNAQGAVETSEAPTLREAVEKAQ